MVLGVESREVADRILAAVCDMKLMVLLKLKYEVEVDHSIKGAMHTALKKSHEVSLKAERLIRQLRQRLRVQNSVVRICLQMLSLQCAIMYAYAVSEKCEYSAGRQKSTATSSYDSWGC